MHTPAMSASPTPPPSPEEVIKALRIFYRRVYALSQQVQVPVTGSRARAFSGIREQFEEAVKQALHSQGDPELLAEALVHLAARCGSAYATLFVNGMIRRPEPDPVIGDAS